MGGWRICLVGDGEWWTRLSLEERVGQTYRHFCVLCEMVKMRLLVTQPLLLVIEMGSCFWVMALGFKGSRPWAMSKLTLGLKFRLMILVCNPSY